MAIEEGMNQGTESTEGAQSAPQTGESSAPAATGTQNASPASNGVTGQGIQPDKSLDFRNSPEFRGIRKENQRYKDQLERQSREIAEMRGMMQASQRQSSGLPTQDEETLQKLFGMAFQSPRVMELFKQHLGLDKIGQLEKGLNELSESWNGSQSDTEMESVRESAKSLGLDADEVEDALKESVETHPVWSQVGYKRGAWKSLYRDLFFDRAGEFRERASNQETIKKREALKAGQTQVPGQGKASPGSKSADDVFNEAFRGGIDFSR